MLASCKHCIICLVSFSLDTVHNLWASKASIELKNLVTACHL